MRTRNAVWMCAAVAIGCGSGEQSGSVPSSETTCSVIQASGVWWNQGFAAQSGRFHVELDATPSVYPIDAVVGLAAGPASTFSDLAAIVRFNPSGTIDARAGDTYRADTMFSYAAGTLYHFRIDVDLQSHTYSAYFSYGAGQEYFRFALDYPFRTEQASVGSLADVASEVDSASGSVQVCRVTMVADGTTADGCRYVAAGDGFVTTAIPDATTVLDVQLQALPSIAPLDGVIGVSSGAATSFSGIAAGMRFAPSGYLDARSGGAYIHDQSVPYTAGRSYDIRMIFDLPSHTYSVFTSSGGETVELAKGYSFRAEQQTVADLDHRATVIDSASGSLKLCGEIAVADNQMLYTREGDYSIAPLPDDSVIVADATTITKLDASGHAVNQNARGGQVVVDPRGNVFLARVASGTLSVDFMNSGLTVLTTHNVAIDPSLQLQSIGVDAADDVLVVLGPYYQTPTYLVELGLDGAVRWQRPISADGVGVGPDGFVLGHMTDTQTFLDRYDRDGNFVSSLAFSGRAQIQYITVDNAGGLTFAGIFLTPISFGGATLQPYSVPEGETNGFVARLTPDDRHLFSERTGDAYVGGLAGNGDRTVVSGMQRTQIRYDSLHVLDYYGNPVQSAPTSAFGERGEGRGVAMSGHGRIFWDLYTGWPSVSEWPYMVVFGP